MKKWMMIVGGVMVVAIVATMFAGAALAQGPSDDSDGIRDLDGLGHGPAWGFVDEDGDGVNDRYTSDCQFVDEDGDGICDVHGVAPGEGYDGSYGFTDQDGDGICDNYGIAPGRGFRYNNNDAPSYGNNARQAKHGMSRGRRAAGQ